MRRRNFLKTAGLAAAACLAGRSSATLPAPAAAPTPPPRDPRWRGFNLLELFAADRPAAAFREADFEMMAEWGFNFARIPMSYWHWSRPDPAQWMTIDEKPIRYVDGVVELGRRHGVHINLNLHRIPGYCINGREQEPLDLFTGPAEQRARALAAACHHWAYLARRYRGLPATQLSFDLINEPPSMPPARYVEVVRALVAAIRAEDPQRLIVADGINVGRTPVLELADLGIMQSARGYDPIQVSHYQAPWMDVPGRESWPVPTWPLRIGEAEVWDRARLRRELIVPWQALEARGVKVHVGEWGAFHFTPHAVTLAWMQDLLELWQEAGWGWALWSLRGEFGVLDSTRADVKYEAHRGLQLDRKMLELLQRY